MGGGQGGGGIDRNQIARMQHQAQQQLRHAIRAFAGDFATGKAAVLDRFAVVVKVGDLVIWQPPHDMVFEVIRIDPVLEPIPGQPIGMITATLRMTAPVGFQAGAPAMKLLVVGHQQDETTAELVTPSGGDAGNVVPFPGGSAYTPTTDAAAQERVNDDGSGTGSDDRNADPFELV